MFGEEELVKVHKTRAGMIGNIVFAAFGLLLARLWYLQVYKGEQLHQFSIQNRLRKEVVWAPRGMIHSRDDQLLVDNIPRYDAILTPQYLLEREVTLEKLHKILMLEPGSIEKLLKKNQNQATYRPITIKKNIGFEELAQIESLNAELPGVSVQTFISREYKDKEVGAHLLGYISEISQQQLPKFRKRDAMDYRLGDFIGQFGIEEQLDKFLRGANGHEFVEVDSRGRRKRYINTDNLFKGIENEVPNQGMNVKLTIDRDMQMAGYAALEGKVGSIIAIDIESGEVLAMVSRPAFDPSQFSRGLTPEYWRSLITNKENPLRDRNIQEHYSPGSTFKAITGISAFEEGVIDENTEVFCNGNLRFGRKVYHCWKREGHGATSITKAIRESCNVFFQRAAMKMSIDTIAKYANMFGLGKRTGISLPREVSGLIPTEAWKQKRYGQVWQPGETLSCAIGQSYVLASTIQMAQAYGAIANGGVLMKPRLIDRIVKPNGDTEIMPPQPVWQVCTAKTAATLRDFLEGVVVEGTGKRAALPDVRIGGKTGTTRRYDPEKKRYIDGTYLTSFVGMAPIDNPKLVCLVMLDDPKAESSAMVRGGRVAAPIFAEVVRETLDHLAIRNERPVKVAAKGGVQ